MAVDVALNIQSPKVLNAGDLFNQLLPIETVTLPTTGSQSTNSTTKNKAYNTYTPNFAFKEDFKDFHLQKPLDPQQLERNCFFPIDGYPYLSQNSTGLAFYANVLSPLRNIFNYEFDVVPQMEINGSQADHTLLNKEGKIFVVVGMKPYHSFLEEKLDDADQLIEKLQRSLHLSGEAGNKVMDESFFKQNPGEPVEAWQTRVGFKVHRDEDYQVLLPEAKTHKKPEETISQYRFRHAVKQLSCCLFELKRKVAFGILSSYCHTYFLILEHGSNGTSATLKISPVVNFCENDIFKKIAEFIVLANATPLEDINTIIDVIPRDIEDSAGGRKNENRGQREEENKGSITKNKKADGSNHNRPQGDFQFSLGDVLGGGRHGVVFEIIDSKGKSFAAKRAAIESSEEIIHELEQEIKVSVFAVISIATAQYLEYQPVNLQAPPPNHRTLQVPEFIDRNRNPTLAYTLQLPRADVPNVPFYNSEELLNLQPPRNEHQPRPTYYEYPTPAVDLQAPTEGSWNPNNDPNLYYSNEPVLIDLETPTDMHPKKYSKDSHEKKYSGEPKKEILLTPATSDDFARIQKTVNKLAKLENQKQIRNEKTEPTV